MAQTFNTFTLQWVVSLVGGGLSGGVVTTILNRFFQRRTLRTQFYLKLNDIYGAYLMRLSWEAGRYLVATTGKELSKDDAEFADRRGTFLHDLAAFNELTEVRKLRKTIVENMREECGVRGVSVGISGDPLRIGPSVRRSGPGFARLDSLRGCPYMIRSRPQ
jgi:hypothetical protein